MNDFDFDLIAHRFSNPLYPDESIKQLFGSKAAKQPGSYNLSGIADPAIDALLDKVVAVRRLGQLRHRIARARPALRAKHFWVPQWNKPDHWFAYWDMFSRPEKVAQYDPGVLDTWWFDADKAAKIGKTG